MLSVANYDLFGDLDAKDPAADLLHMMEIQQRMTIDGISYVGGHAVLTPINANSVTQRIVHRWNEDAVGKKVVPI